MSGTIGPGGWWAWPLAVGLTALIPVSVRWGWTVAGLAPISLAGAVCLLLLVALWWGGLAPRISWNHDGFAARGVGDLHRATWSDARSVFIAAGHRLVIVTPSGRYDVRMPWSPGRVRLAMESIRAARGASPPPSEALEHTIDLAGRLAPPGPSLDALPRLTPPLVQFGLLLMLWTAGMGLALLAGP